MFHQVDLIATPCYDRLSFDHYRSLTIAKMLRFFHVILHKRIKFVAKPFLPFLKQVDHSGITNHLASFESISCILSDDMKP